jgi:hypothetical protein
MKKLKQRFLQHLADYIIERLQLELNSKYYNEKVFFFYLEMGQWLDFYAIEYWNIELN